MVVSTGKQALAFFHLSLSSISIVTELVSCKMFCVHQILQWDRLACSRLKICSPAGKKMMWYKKMLSPLYWEYRAWLARLLISCLKSYKCQKQKASILLLAKYMPVTESTPCQMVVSSRKTNYFFQPRPLTNNQGCNLAQLTKDLCPPYSCHGLYQLGKHSKPVLHGVKI